MKTIKTQSHFTSLFYVLALLFINLLSAQSVTIREHNEIIKTYSFDDPNPVPILEENPKIYPYFKFEGYEHTAKNKTWKVVTLENDYIKLSVLPEAGGKVWGAIEKQTGEEFIYKNDVLKFRNIAMRGPWTSGGIEFNFGIIGHTPATATPVDYTIKENEDGSVSCIVGAMDLPSRTHWWVEINLQKDKAYFETKASWYNASPVNQSYYNWMTAAAAASNDLEFFIPGDQYLKHNGNAMLWPIDEQGRELSFYKNNNFGPHKSYHIVGDYKDFFGGYYHNTNFGFGHWSPYEEMPGQKLWLWALSRSGGIWEDLLTDTDGQYIEFQAGRLFNQYAPDKAVNPITQANFEPYILDSWSELWFPFKDIGGMVAASEFGVLNIEYEDHKAHIGLNALQEIKDYLKVLVNGTEVINEKIEMNPMDVLTKTVSAKPNDVVQVIIGINKLIYTSNPEETLLKRPFYSDTALQISTSEKLYTQGWEAMKFRVYDEAHTAFSELIKLDPSHQGALVKLAELEYRRTNYNTALKHINAALKIDTYNPEANYKAGIVYRVQNDFINALESFGWAARDMKYRSVSYAQMAEIYLHTNHPAKAKKYALKALDFNAYNLNAKKVLLVLARQKKNANAFKHQLSEILSIAPLDHFAAMETTLFEGGTKINISNEFPNETILELAIHYYNLGLRDEAVMLLKNANQDVKSMLWLAYLLRYQDHDDSDQVLEALNRSSDFVSPYRRETLPVLQWAAAKKAHWKLNYYLAQNYLAVGLKDEGNQLLKACKNEPDADTFYRFRATSLSTEDYNYRLQDYQKALALNSNNWKSWEDLIQFYFKYKKTDVAYINSQKAYKKFPNNYNIALVYAKALMLNKKYKSSINILRKQSVLPSELATESRKIYFDTHVFLANDYIKAKKYAKAIQILEDSKKWPENLGVGKPYNVDNRLQDYLLALCYAKLKDKKTEITYLQDILDYTRQNQKTRSINRLFGGLTLKKLGQNEALDKFISALKNSNQDSSINEVILACLNNDKTEQLKLKAESNISDGLWEVIETSLGY